MFVFARQSIILKGVCGKLYRVRGSGRAQGEGSNERGAESLATLGHRARTALFSVILDGDCGREDINYALSDLGE